MLIVSQATLAANLQRLQALDPLMQELHAGGVAPPLRKREGGFSGLVGIIMAQQLSVASASAINARLHAAITPLTPETLLAASIETLVAAGLSQPKIRAVRAIAQAVVDGMLALEDLGDMPGEQAHAALVAVSGVGPWTAEIYLLFCLGHPDVFPAGDLALQEAARQALHLEHRPDTALMTTLAKRWSPHRGGAALMLWAFYAVIRAREGVTGLAPQTAGAASRPAKQWRPQQRPGLIALLEDPGFAHPPSSQNDLIEGPHAADPALRLASAKAMHEIMRSQPLDDDWISLIANRLLAEHDVVVRKALIRLAPALPQDDAAATRIFGALSRLTAGPSSVSAAEKVMALGALDKLARRRPALTSRLNRFVAGLDEKASSPLGRAIARRSRASGGRA